MGQWMGTQTKSENTIDITANTDITENNLIAATECLVADLGVDISVNIFVYLELDDISACASVRKKCNNNANENIDNFTDH